MRSRKVTWRHSAPVKAAGMRHLTCQQARESVAGMCVGRFTTDTPHGEHSDTHGFVPCAGARVLLHKGCRRQEDACTAGQVHTSHLQ